MSPSPQTKLPDTSLNRSRSTNHQSPLTTHHSPLTNSCPRLDGVFTVDVEDYFQVTAFEGQIDRKDWDSYQSRVVANTHCILSLLASHSVRGTFFILGWTADRYPELVREIHNAGHEIGSHSYWHRCVYDQTPDQFRQDLCQSRDTLSDIIGDRVTCYRAPTFSITERSKWALEILVEEGFSVDSSIFPVFHDRYGMPDAQRIIHELDTPSGPIWEYPLTVARFGTYHLPVAGGGYFRLYPFAFTERCLRNVQRENKTPFMFYTHPWEVDPTQPRLRAGSRLSRFRHYVNLGKSQWKLDRLLSTYRLGRICDVMAGVMNSHSF